MIIPAPNDVAFSIFGIKIYMYGIIMAFAIFVAIIIANKLLNIASERKNIILDSAPLIIAFGILGARLYFCSLTPEYYFNNPIEILDIREGGLSVHGAILGGILSLIIITVKYKIRFLDIADPCACATILGQAIGRWGNYFNSEAYGIPVSSQKWGLYIPIQNRVAEYSSFSLFHPTFLYESILDLTAFALLIFIFTKYREKYPGIALYSYMAIYAIIRFFIEQIRTDSALNIGTIPLAIFASIIMFLIGGAGIIYTLVKKY